MRDESPLVSAHHALQHRRPPGTYAISWADLAPEGAERPDLELQLQQLPGHQNELRF